MQHLPIIYRSHDELVFVIDIPASIASAQGDSDWCSRRRLLSCLPRDEPYPGNEPKSDAGSSRISNHDNDLELHDIYSKILHKVISDLKNETLIERYCHERGVAPKEARRSGKRKAENDGSSTTGLTERDDDPESFEYLSGLLNGLSQRTLSLPAFISNTQIGYEEDENISSTFASNSGTNENEDLPNYTIHELCYNNETERMQNLHVKVATARQGATFIIPPKSAFLLGKCENFTEFRSAARNFNSGSRGRFDFILLDPPWPNRSATRKSSYGTSGDVNFVRKLLMNMDLDAHTIPGGFIAVWITNRPLIRSILLDPGGIFEAWNVTLVEEWIWLKVTSTGTPVIPIDCVWRKPYEILLIGKAPEDSMSLAEPRPCAMRRVLVGVPDLHSRKPCLKQLVEEVLLRRNSQYYALEVFARHLVSAWFSWGDEVLKYNWHAAWS